MGDEPTNVVDHQLDPKRLFELVLRNYKLWQEAMNRDVASRDDSYPRTPDPGASHAADSGADDATGDTGGEPVLNYNLFELLDKTPAEIDLQAIMATVGKDGIVKPNLNQPSLLAPSPTPAPLLLIPPPPPTAGETLSPLYQPDAARVTELILNEQEIDFLRQKILQMINFRPLPSAAAALLGGMSLYDTQDERGIVDDDDQDDYDLDELAADEYYKSHHIEVELNLHRQDECTCGDDHTDDGPTCEFTFEYDNLGKLVPTYSNVEEKLRLMGLQHKLGANGTMKLPLILELNLIDQAAAASSDHLPLPAGLKKKKHKKKKKKDTKLVVPAPSPAAPMPPGAMLAYGDCCLLCEYEFIYGKKPRQLIKWYNQRLRREEQRRQEIKRKIESVKQRAIKRQQHRVDPEEPPLTSDDHDDTGIDECYDDDHHHAELCPHHHPGDA